MHYSLVTLRFVLGENQARIFVMGKEAAQLNLEKDVQLLNITAFKEGGGKEELRFEPGEGFYTIKKWPEDQGLYRLDVRMRASDVTEEIKIDVSPRR